MLRSFVSRFARCLLLGLCSSLLAGVQAQDFVVALSFAGGGWFDRSFNEATWAGVARAVRDIGQDRDVDLLIYDLGPDAQGSQGLRNIAATGVDLIVAAGFLQRPAIEAIARDFPEVDVVLIDDIVEASNVRSVIFREHEGSFMVGYIAGSLSQTGIVGFVGGMDIPLIRAFGLGYRSGVLAACSDCQVLEAYIGDSPLAFNNPSRARELAAQQQQQGADIIYAAAGNSGQGVIAHITETMCYDPAGMNLRETPLRQRLADIPLSDAYAAACQGREPLFFIGVDSNQNFLGDTDGDPSTLNHGLTSMLKRVDIAAENAVQDVAAGRFRGGLQRLGLAEGGVGYALDIYNRTLIPETLVLELESVRESIVRGDIRVPDYRQLPAETP